MNDVIKNENKGEKKSRQMELARKAWFVLIPLFGVIILLNLYYWWQGKGSWTNMLPPMTMICVGLAMLVSVRNKPLYIFFIAVGIILSIMTVASLFIR